MSKIRFKYQLDVSLISIATRQSQKRDPTLSLTAPPKTQVVPPVYYIGFWIAFTDLGVEKHRISWCKSELEIWNKLEPYSPPTNSRKELPK